MNKSAEMEVFVRVADSGGFSAAARVLKLTPSAVSKQIGRLEDRLGVRLFHRTTRSLSLTDEGRAFYERCTAILTEIEQAEEAVTALHGSVSGKLRILATVAFTRVHVLPMMPEFIAKHPDLHIELDLSDRTTDLVEDGIDVAIRLQEQMDDESLVARRLSANRRVICATPAYLAAHGTPHTPDDLVNHNCLRHSAISEFNDWEFEDRSGSRTLRVKGNFETNSAYALYEAVMANMGIARLATWIIQPDLDSGRLVPLLNEWTHDKSSILVVYPHRRHLSNKVRAFVDFLVDKFTPVPPWERPDWQPRHLGSYRRTEAVQSSVSDPQSLNIE